MKPKQWSAHCFRKWINDKVAQAIPDDPAVKLSQCPHSMCGHFRIFFTSITRINFALIIGNNY